TPSSAGMLSVATRTSLPKPQACVTDAILSTTTVRISLTSSTGMEHARQRNDLRKTQCVLRGPFARGFAVHAARDGHQRMRRFDAFDEQTTGPEQHVDLARDALLRRQEQGLDVPAHGIEQLAFVHPVAIRAGERILDPLLS